MRRELAPLAGHYPALQLGPAWWFHDSPEGMRRFREQTTETAGFYNTVGFNDDTRAFLSIPARHDVARRVDCGFLARLVAEHRLDEDEAAEVAVDLAYNLPKQAYKLDKFSVAPRAPTPDGRTTVFKKTYHATHPDMMDGATNDAAARPLSDRRAVRRRTRCALNYSHNERFVIGGAAPVAQAVDLPAQTEPASAAGKPFLERRELGVVNVGDGAGRGHRRWRGLRRWRRATASTCRWARADVASSRQAQAARALLPRLDAGARALRDQADLASTRPCRWNAARWRPRTSAPSTSTSCPPPAGRRSCCWA